MLTFNKAKSRPAASYIHSCTCAVFRVVIPCVKFLKRSTNALECMNVVCLQNNHQHGSAHPFGHLQGREKKRTITIIIFGFISTNYYCNRILVLTTLQMAKLVTETCWWLVCNNITFISAQTNNTLHYVSILNVLHKTLTDFSTHICACLLVPSNFNNLECKTKEQNSILTRV